MIELDQLLYGTCSQEEVNEFFLNGEFYEEHYSVDAIKRHLMDNDDIVTLSNANISVEDLLNGRFNGAQEPIIERIMDKWNQKLGHRYFGF